MAKEINTPAAGAAGDGIGKGNSLHGAATS